MYLQHLDNISTSVLYIYYILHFVFISCQKARYVVWSYRYNNVYHPQWIPHPVYLDYSTYIVLISCFLFLLIAVLASTRFIYFFLFQSLHFNYNTWNKTIIESSVDEPLDHGRMGRRLTDGALLSKWKLVVQVYYNCIRQTGYVNARLPLQCIGWRAHQADNRGRWLVRILLIFECGRPDLY